MFICWRPVIFTIKQLDVYKRQMYAQSGAQGGAQAGPGAGAGQQANQGLSLIHI